MGGAQRTLRAGAGLRRFDAAPARAAAAVGDAATYTVQSGDTLWAISEKAYGNGSKYELIFEANKPMLTHPDKIYPGQVLRIPDIAEA